MGEYTGRVYELTDITITVLITKQREADMRGV